MPTSEAPSKLNEKPETPELGDAAEQQPQRGASTSRWVDYDTHQLLQMINELEDERRWARLREGILWAVLFHILLVVALILLPKYVFKMIPVVDTNNIQGHPDFTYLDAPFVPPPKPAKPLAQRPQIDSKTLEELKKQAPPAPAEQAPPPPQKAEELPKPQAPPPIPPAPQTQSQIEAPRPSAVPAKPNFSQLSQNPADQLQQAMRDAARNRGQGGQMQVPGGLPKHPGAGTGGLQILSDTQGVDFSAWLAAWYYETRKTWEPLIPPEVDPPLSRQGQVMIRFKVLPNGRIMDGSMTLEGRSGDSALDRAAWGALQWSNYPQLPHDFHGPYLELRALFLYNLQPPQ